MEHNLKNSLGCGKEFDMRSSSGFICGVANAWGQERLCKSCDLKMRADWNKWDQERELRNINKKGVKLK